MWPSRIVLSWSSSNLAAQTQLVLSNRTILISRKIFSKIKSSNIIIPLNWVWPHPMDFWPNFKWLPSNLWSSVRRSKSTLVVASKCSSISKISVLITRQFFVKISSRLVSVNLDRTVVMLMVIMNWCIKSAVAPTKIIKLKCVNSGMKLLLGSAPTVTSASLYMMKGQVLWSKEKLWASRKSLRKKIFLTLAH